MTINLIMIYKRYFILKVNNYIEVILLLLSLLALRKYYNYHKNYITFIFL